MEPQALILPVALYVIYIGCFPLINLFMRIKAAKAGQVDASYYKLYADKNLVTERLLVFERHIDNQFQVPVIFMVTTVAYLALDKVDAVAVGLAWAFVISRWIHSFIHLGKNKILQRATVYGIGISIVVAQWIYLLCIT